jgi:phage tail-like protein
VTDHNPSEAHAARPLPAFRFHVIWGTAHLSFQEVSGLGADTQAIEAATGPPATAGQLTMKTGIYVGSEDISQWLTSTQDAADQSNDVTIELLDESRKPLMAWTLANPHPAKIEGASGPSGHHEVAIERLQIAHDGLVLANR